MKDDYKRLLIAASELRGWHGPTAVAAGLTAAGYEVSEQTIHNWKTRGISSIGYRKAAPIIGCRAAWLEFATGQMADATSTQTASFTGQSSPDNKRVKTMRNLAHVVQLPERDQATIPQFEAGGSMGHGMVLPDQPGIIHNWNVSREWLEKNARSHTGVDNLRIVTGFGPSMQPLFNPGDPLLVDAGVKSVIADGVYFFRVGEEGFIKQLQKIPTTRGVKYVAKSKNPDYDPFEITEGMDFEVLARVIRVWCGTDF